MIEVSAPPSKSYTQRALIAASLARGTSEIVSPLLCDDTLRLRRALEKLGARISDSATGWLVRGRGYFEGHSRFLHLGKSGTALRFLAATSIASRGALKLTGSPALCIRPLEPLLEALFELGIDAAFSRAKGHAPLSLLRSAREPARSVFLRGDVSSQFVSGLLLAAPASERTLRIEAAGHLVSSPYVGMTLSVMSAFGVRVRHSGLRSFLVPAGLSYRPARYVVEVDHSAAAFIFAASRLAGRKVRIANLKRNSLQPDRVFSRLAARIFSEGRLEIDVRETPDLVPPLVACALFAGAEVKIKGAGHLRWKESDRLKVLSAELRKIGARLSETEDGLIAEPSRLHGGAVLDPHSDHRIAMCFGLVSLRLPGIQIRNRSCVAKSFPGFWETLALFR